MPDVPHTPVVEPVFPVKADKKPEFINGKKSADSKPVRGGGQAGYAGGYTYSGDGFMQNSPIVQPLAIVPYVTQEQPLWQYASKADYERMRRNNAKK